MVSRKQWGIIGAVAFIGFVTTAGPPGTALGMAFGYGVAGLVATALYNHGRADPAEQ